MDRKKNTDTRKLQHTEHLYNRFGCEILADIYGSTFEGYRIEGWLNAPGRGQVPIGTYEVKPRLNVIKREAQIDLIIDQLIALSEDV